MSTTLDHDKFAPPVLEGPVRDTGQLQLRPLEAEDYPWLHSWETTSWMAGRWRWRGRTIPPDEWVMAIKAMPFQFLVCRLTDDGLLRKGIVYAYNDDPVNGTIYLAGSRFHEYPPPEPWPTDMTRGAALLLNYLFSRFDYRKVYLEVPGYNEGEFTAEGVQAGFMVEEGRLRDHAKLDGKLWDLTTYAVWRETWMGEPIQGLLRAGLAGEL